MDGILVKPYLVPKIVAGEKDVTRRLAGLAEINKEPDKWQGFEMHGDEWLPVDLNGFPHGDKQLRVKPRYHIGQIKFIREAHWRWGYWTISNKITRLGNHHVVFKGTNQVVFQKPSGVLKISDKADVGWFKRSPLFLEAKHARHFIQITDVKGERLQEITPEEAVREGCGDLGIIPANTAMILTGTTNLEDCARKLTVAQFSSLWDNINPQYPFASNPHVLRIKFKYLPDYKYVAS